ncbi:thioesterase II family protein [Nonomuraea sp. NEAU-A123]|uniref:thioesterase II family protein n=1 Tax=Nonomuraea sp. NEAU-A123 TaxID=2839649 RepID=UPI001BE44DF2|nr:alpha/beta fold hydrolase [Nonomuraea sp. NEAU-A123]MBT2227581.1 alpha/beta fold hydrolase [Nonomuraea sp. NEAU-A123]
MSTSAAEACFWTPRRRPGAALRAICFPHAGGDALSYASLARALPDDVEVLALRMPRPGDRRAEPAPDLATFAGRIAGALADLAPPYMVVGQSLGALIAFEAARAVPGTPPTACLFISSAPPHRWAETLDLYATTGAGQALLSYLRDSDGTMGAALDDPAVGALVLRDLRADLRLLQGYAASVEPRLTCPVRVLLGAEDPALSPDDVAGWSRYTSGPCSIASVPTGHFVVRQGEAFVVQEITRVATAGFTVEGEGCSTRRSAGGSQSTPPRPPTAPPSCPPRAS